jgi:hypothetical protein
MTHGVTQTTRRAGYQRQHPDRPVLTERAIDHEKL